MKSEKKLLSVVIPVYNEEAVVAACYERLVGVAEALPSFEYELIFVNDGSSDETGTRLEEISERNARVKVVKFSRNFGHQIAITAGLDHAAGDCIVIIDADLQDPPEVIPAMIEKWQEGFDVVYGLRARRKGEGRMKLLTASGFYRLLNRLTKIDIPVDVGDFRLMSRRAADQLRAMREQDRFVRGLTAWIGYRQTGVTYVRDPRMAGETKFPYSKMLKFALDGITSFSTLPLKLATWLGYSASVLAFLYLISVFVQRALGHTVQGWATIMVALLFLGGVQLICTGILGEYIGRMFTELKARPLYVVEETINVETPRTARAFSTQFDVVPAEGTEPVAAHVLHVTQRRNA